MLNNTNNNPKQTENEIRINNQALILEQEILGTFLNILAKTDNQHGVLKDLQQDFIGYFDNGDYKYLRDGNIILTEILSIFHSISMAEPEALDRIFQNNQKRINKISNIFNV